MPTFDITSEFDPQEVLNAVDQAHREISNRYDFRDTGTIVSYSENTITLKSSTSERLAASEQVLKEKFAKRNVSIKFLVDFKDESTPSEFKRFYNLKSGIDQDSSKKIIATIRENNKKIQCSYQNQQIRVTSKKRDDLQNVIQLVKDSKFDIPLNYGNFRD
ncbi:MAG: YajQ family cyclic di-GMP-binding protein [Actinobacteria bacterium]|nr:YajQ family cyclic di-GMP-binding protein [Actinomycetota bacterium]